MKKNPFQPFKFPDFETPTYQVLPKESQSSEQTIKQGLNLSGICQNNECSAYQKQVVVSLGYHDKFIVAKEIRKAKCVKCSKKLQKVRLVKIYMAEVKGKGRKIGGEETDQECDSYDPNVSHDKQNGRKVSFWHISDEKDKLMSFGSKDKQIVLWDYLHLQVKRLTKQKKCLNGHKLSKLSQLYSSWVEHNYGGTKYAEIFEGFEKVGKVFWTCDKCDNKLKGQEMARSCRECNYDMCMQCCNK